MPGPPSLPIIAMPSGFLNQVFYLFAVFRHYVGMRMLIVFLLTLLSAVSESIGIAMLLPLLEVVDVGLGQTVDSGIGRMLHSALLWIGIEQSLIGILIFIGLIFFVKGLIKFGEHVYHSYLREDLQKELRGKLLEHYSSMNYTYYAKRDTGHFINVITTQVAEMLAAFQYYKMFLVAVVTSVVYIVIASLVAFSFAMMTMVAGLFFLLIMRRLNHYVRRLSQAYAHENGVLNKFIVQLLQAFKYLTSTGQFGYLKVQAQDSIGRHARLQKKTQIAQGFTVAMQEPLSVLLILALIIVQIVFLDQPLAPIAVSLILLNRAMAQIVSIQTGWQNAMSKVGALEKVEQELQNLRCAGQENGSQALAPLQQAIEWQQVDFSYDEQEVLFQNLSLIIPARQTVAFVGSSGAGKSTLVDMLTLLLAPQAGRLLIDGVDGREVDRPSWRRQIGYVSQDVVVFDDTIANNIALWQADYSNVSDSQRIEEAARQACADRFIDELPDGYQTLVGDRGIRLSGGQKQRLFIARELFKNPQLLILDEATSALDSESERYIQESIQDLKGRLTVVIIAHRLSTIRDADCIYVLEKGQIQEQGSYQELMERDDSVFASMVELQRL